MRKTRFFLIKQELLLALMGWMLLLNWGVSLSIEKMLNEYQKTEGEKESVYPSDETEDSETIRRGNKDTEAVAENSSADSEIRVLLMDTDYRSYYHPMVEVRINGERVTYSMEDEVFDQKPLVLSESENGIEVLSVQRQEGNPVYQGTLEITRTDQGFLLVNVLPLEEYLEAVVPGEMPSSYHIEALKAQAVCARTYAQKHMEEESLAEYGADVDDSVNYQVYGNILPRESTTQAVKDTEGQVLCQKGELIQAYYFSTSAGVTSTDEIWGSETSSYLKSVECPFDEQEPWAKWEAEFSWERLRQQAEKLYGAAGELKSVEIVKKNQSNAVTGLRLNLDEEIILEGEYEIRRFLSPEGTVITGRNGEDVEGGMLLPSAYFTLEQNPGECIIIHGGGYGHGVGMSQTAANQMAKTGYSYQEILMYFFNNVELCVPLEKE